MKKVLSLAVLAIFAVSLSAFAGDTKSKMAGEKSASGTIAKLDPAAKALAVTDAKGASLTFQWTDATKILGGELSEGATVKVGYTEGDGKMWATWIKVQPPR